MAGRRRTGAAAAGIQAISYVAAKDLERRFDEQAEDRKFRQRLEELGVKSGIETGQIAPTFVGGRVSGFQPAQDPFAGVTLPRLTEQGTLPQGAPQSGGSQPGMPGQSEQEPELDWKLTIDSTGKKSFTQEPRKLSPREQLFQEFRRAQAAIPQAQAQVAPQVSRVASFAAQPPSGLMSEAAQAQRPAAFGRAQDIVQSPVLQAQNRLGELQTQVGQLRGAGLLGSIDQPTGTEEFRRDLQDGIKAVQEGRIGKKEAIRRLLEAYPDKANTILRLEQSIF